jgi:hypothetical protein
MVGESVFGRNIFSAWLHHNGLSTFPGMWWCMHKIGDTNLRLEIDGEIEEATLAVAVLLAFCLVVPQDMLESPPSPLTVILTLRGGSSGATAFREAMDLLAPLRPLTESVALYGSYDSDPVVVERQVQTRPLGVLNVMLRMNSL